MASAAKHPGARPARISKVHLAAVVDPLERRTLLSAILLPDGTLQVTGTDGPDQVTLRRGAEGNKLNVQEGSTTLFVFLLAQIKSIDVNLGAGDDTLNVDTTPGLIAASSGDLPIWVDGGPGNDSLQVFGAPPGGALDEVLTPGPEAGAGTLVGRISAGPAQGIHFAGLESLVDTSAAASLTVSGNDGRNLVELSSGPLAGGVTPTGAVRLFDVSPAQPTPTPPPTTPPPPKPPSDSKDEAKRAAKEQAKEAKQQAKQAKEQAKRLAKEAKRLAREQRKAESKARKHKTAPNAPAAQPSTSALTAAAPAPESLVVGRAYLTIYFANKSAVVINAAAGDDRVDVNFTGPAPAGLATLTVDGGDGTDTLSQPAAPAGVTLQVLNVESTSATRDFALATDAMPAVDPPLPPEPPPALHDKHDDKDDDEGDDDDHTGKDGKDDEKEDEKDKGDKSRDGSSSDDDKDHGDDEDDDKDDDKDDGHGGDDD